MCGLYGHDLAAFTASTGCINVHLYTWNVCDFQNETEKRKVDKKYIWHRLSIQKYKQTTNMMQVAYKTRNKNGLKTVRIVSGFN